jgi:predicted AAA+ superfamily ATPase
MIKREIERHLMRVAENFPVITVLGPRQSGKTTLVKAMFPNHYYINLENVNLLRFAKDDPISFFKRYPAPIILDEVQRLPELLSTIQVLADDCATNGQFILTGSHQPALHAEISQSLAGRTGIVRLLPFSITELANAKIDLDRDEYLYFGFMPGVHAKKIAPDLFYSNYYSTYLERDVRQLVNVNNIIAFETFIKLLAGRVGQVVNLNSLSGDIGVSSTTLSSWLSVLEASYIIFRMPCYFKNFGKRLIKSPKIYFTEVGLAAWLLGIENANQVASHHMLGSLFENMVVIEALKTRYNIGKKPELYYFRDKYGFEVDLILNKNFIQPIEIKAARTYDSSLANKVRKFSEKIENAKSPSVIYAGEQSFSSNGIDFKNFKQTAEII